MEEKKAKLIYLHNKKHDITYVYENQSYWCKIKKQPRSIRKLIGKIDKVTNTIVPTRTKKGNIPHTEQQAQDNILPPLTTKRKFYGATYLLDAIGGKLGIIEDLEYCFPTMYKQILSIAYYLILEDSSSMSRFERWSDTHHHPYGKNIPSQRISELFASVSEDAKTKFFKLQSRRRSDKEYWAYDITTISSYSETLRHVQYGHNKENDSLPQLNLALVYGEESGLPFYYRKLAGNIPDSKTLRTLLTSFSSMGFNDIGLIMDRGFYSEANINDLYKEQFKFLVATKTSLKFIKKNIDLVYDNIRSYQNYDQDYCLYGSTIPAEWDYTELEPNKTDLKKDNKPIYVHIYFNSNKAVDEEQNFDVKLAGLSRELLTEKTTKHAKNTSIIRKDT